MLWFAKISFVASEVISPSGEPGVTDYNHRRSRVLMDLGPHEEVILDRIRLVLPSVLRATGDGRVSGYEDRSADHGQQ